MNSTAPLRLCARTFQDAAAPNFTWTALYGGLDRRIETVLTPSGTSSVVRVQSTFDPEADHVAAGRSSGRFAKGEPAGRDERERGSQFLELSVGVALGSSPHQWSHKIYGPDLSGAYGGLQGQGGLEAIKSSDGTTRGIVNDWWGNAVGHVTAPGAQLTWAAWQHLAWGPTPGYGTAPQDGSKQLHELIGHRGLTVDPPGLIQHGLRYYDPEVGRWLSPDPAGHSGSLSLYDYCDNDPVNQFDPDGRCVKATASVAYNGFGVGQGLRAAGSGLESWAASSNTPWVAGIGGAANGVLGGIGGVVTPSAYVNAGISGYRQGGVFGAINTFNPLTPFHDAITGHSAVSGRSLSAVDRFQSAMLSISLGASIATAPAVQAGVRAGGLRAATTAIGAEIVGSAAPIPLPGLAARTGVPRITEKGITRIEQHLSRPGLEDLMGNPAIKDPANARMIERLRSGQTTQQDINFYMHELKESAIMNRGVGPRDAHLQTLEWQRIPYTRGYESQLYAPDAAAFFNSVP